MWPKFQWIIINCENNTFYIKTSFLIAEKRKLPFCSMIQKTAAWCVILNNAIRYFNMGIDFYEV